MGAYIQTIGLSYECYIKYISNLKAGWKKQIIQL